MAQNPETRFTNKLRKMILETDPDAYIVKHADSFNHGVPDIEVVLPGKPIAISCWFEIKWVPEITKTRKIKYRPLQKVVCEHRASLGLPSGLIVGSPLGIAWYHGSCLPTHVLATDFWKKTSFDIHMFLDAHYGLAAFSRGGRDDS